MSPPPNPPAPALCAAASARAGARHSTGFTLIELLVVLAIMSLLYAIVGPQVMRYLGSSRSEAASAQIHDIDAALRLMRLDTGRYPTTAEGLRLLVTPEAALANWHGPYLPSPAALTDPWGNPYRYANPGKHAEIDIFSFGADNAEGGADEDRDLGNW